jgi:macrolide phosphotransferase
VLRAPRRPDVVEAAARESRILGLVRGCVPVDVPEWRVHTPELIAYPRLAGTPAATVDAIAKGYAWSIDPHSPGEPFLASLAGALAALHGIDPAAAAAAGVRVQSPAAARQAMAEAMDETRSLLHVRDGTWRRWQGWIADDTYWPPHATLVHGDLHPPHILVDPGHRVTGLLDWTEAEVTDPATDFALLYGIMGEVVVAPLIARYRQAGGRVWPRMQEHIIARWSAYPVTIARFVLRTGEVAHLELARMLLAAQQPQA